MIFLRLSLDACPVCLVSVLTWTRPQPTFVFPDIWTKLRAAPICVFVRWHRWLSKRGRRTSKISWTSRQSPHSLRHGDQCWEDQTQLMTNNTCGINTEIKVNGQKLETVTSFKYLGSVTNDEGSKPEIYSRIARTTAAWIDWNQFGMTEVFLSVPRYDWCAPLSHLSSCMLVNHGPSQKSSKEYKPRKWGATARYYASH